MIDSDETAALFAEFEQRHDERARAARCIRASEQVLTGYAEKNLLSKAEAVALVQGFTPPVGDFGDDCTYLEDYANEIQRLLSDVRRGVLPMPCQPRELVAWSVTAGVRLPSIFSHAVDAETARPRVAGVPDGVASGAEPVTEPLLGAGGPRGYDPERQQRLNPIAENLRAPMLAANGPHGYDPELQRSANAIAEELRAQKGHWPTKDKVAQLLAKKSSKTKANVMRRIYKEWGPARQRSQKRVAAKKRRGWPQ